MQEPLRGLAMGYHDLSWKDGTGYLVGEGRQVILAGSEGLERGTCEMTDLALYPFLVQSVCL